MKILIVGSKGFIGSHCLAAFKAAGHTVTGADIEKDNSPNYVNVSDTSFDFNTLFKAGTFDVCINAAGSAHVAYSFQFPEKDFELNVSLVVKLLGAIKNNAPGCKLINFSSAAVYGNPLELPIKEMAETKHLSPYGTHKLLSEKLLNEYHRFFGISTCSLRVFSVYGEGLKKQLFWDIYKKTQNTSEIKLYGTGQESRDFIYIQDLISIVQLVVEKAKFNGSVYNVANGKDVSVKEAASVFLKYLGWGGKVVFSGEKKTGDPLNWKADIQKIGELGYRRRISFEAGISNVCLWLKDLK